MPWPRSWPTITTLNALAELLLHGGDRRCRSRGQVPTRCLFGEQPFVRSGRRGQGARQQFVLRQRFSGARVWPGAAIDRAQELVEHEGELRLVGAARTGGSPDLESIRDGDDLEPWILRLPRGYRPLQRRRQACARAARLDPEPPPEAGRWTLLDAHARFGAGDRRAVGIATAGRLGEIPPRGEAGLDAAEPEGQLGVRGVGQDAVGRRRRAGRRESRPAR